MTPLALIGTSAAVGAVAFGTIGYFTHDAPVLGGLAGVLVGAAVGYGAAVSGAIPTDRQFFFGGVGASAEANSPNPLPATRPGCLECVEKHLGAAWVLINETRDGYQHRMLATGHLHEAEDESQPWPSLHDAIREARKGYQSGQGVPNFVALEKLVESYRGGSALETADPGTAHRAIVLAG